MQLWKHLTTHRIYPSDMDIIFRWYVFFSSSDGTCFIIFRWYVFYHLQMVRVLSSSHGTCFIIFRWYVFYHLQMVRVLSSSHGTCFIIFRWYVFYHLHMVRVLSSSKREMQVTGNIISSQTKYADDDDTGCFKTECTNYDVVKLISSTREV